MINKVFDEDKNTINLKYRANQLTKVSDNFN